MKILSLEANGMHALYPRGVKGFRAHFDDLVIVIGANGSGKSTLLRAAELKAISRTEFDDHCGLHRLSVEDRDGIWAATADFSEKHAYTLVKDGDLEDTVFNIASVQTELIEKHFGMTPAIHGLSTMTKLLTEMGPAERKSWLLSLCPCDLTFILQKHKKLLRKMKDTQATIKHLNGKMGEIQNSLITDDDLNRMTERKKTIDVENRALYEIKIKIEKILSQLREREHNNTTPNTVQNLDQFSMCQTQFLARAREHFSLAGNYIGESGLDAELNKARERLSGLDAQLSELEKQASVHVDKLNKLEALHQTRHADELCYR